MKKIKLYFFLYLLIKVKLLINAFAFYVKITILHNNVIAFYAQINFEIKIN